MHGLWVKEVTYPAIDDIKYQFFKSQKKKEYSTIAKSKYEYCININNKINYQ